MAPEDEQRHEVTNKGKSSAAKSKEISGENKSCDKREQTEDIEVAVHCTPEVLRNSVYFYKSLLNNDGKIEMWSPNIMFTQKMKIIII